MMRISAQEYVEGGYGLEESADLFHIRYGGEGHFSQMEYRHPCRFSVPLAREKTCSERSCNCRRKIRRAKLANDVIGNEDADLVAVGRGELRNPYWTHEAVLKLGMETDVSGEARRYDGLFAV